MPRFFTLLEAEAHLPEVERILRGILESKQQHEAAAGELARIAQRITFAGGMIAPADRVAQLRKRKEATAAALKSAVERLEELGVLLKDADTGLVDFPTLYRDREVYLCWKLGETGIGFWHHVEDGYRGRRPIDSEFLAHHHGGS